MEALVIEAKERTVDREEEAADEEPHLVMLDIQRRMERVVDEFCKRRMEILDTIPEDEEETATDESENEVGPKIVWKLTRSGLKTSLVQSRSEEILKAK